VAVQHPERPVRPARRQHAGSVVQTLAALSMTVGRGRAARTLAAAAELTNADKVVDIGCGTGAAVRHAARHAAGAIGIDPSAPALRLARRIALRGHVRNTAWLAATAEALPLAEGSATVAWALHSLHHWDDRLAGLREIHRVLSPGGRMLLAERQLGHERSHSHGLTLAQATDLARQAVAVGFVEVATETRKSGSQTLVIVRAHRA
jgi:ubiquinone/menaquinone biosynthesis C-methylase UbiE